MNDQSKNLDGNGLATRGSQRQIQIYVNRFPDELSNAIVQNTPSLGMLNPRLRWVSPLEKRKYVEHRDGDFLRALELTEITGSLREFWPEPGPTWDALAIVENDSGNAAGVLLVEAKSYRAELFGGGSKANKPESLMKIQKALDDTARWLRMGYTVAKAFHRDSLYQYANRLAHLYFFNEIVKVPAWLVNVYFLDDPYRPTSLEQWCDFLPEVEWCLGLEGVQIPHKTDLFLAAIRSDFTSAQ